MERLQCQRVNVPYREHGRAFDQTQRIGAKFVLNCLRDKGGETIMINENDILDMTCLTRAQIDAISEHEHIDPVAAAELGEYMMHLHHGAQKVQQMICDDIAEALHADDLQKARGLYDALKQFLAEHPEALRGNG